VVTNACSFELEGMVIHHLLQQCVRVIYLGLSEDGHGLPHMSEGGCGSTLTSPDLQPHLKMMVQTSSSAIIVVQAL